jgi:hypothetical protein
LDKKQAELDAQKKAKDAQHAAGKNSGMSGRDLVSFVRLLILWRAQLVGSDSSRTIQNGLTTRTRVRRRNGIFRNIVKRHKRRWMLLKRLAFLLFKTVIENRLQNITTLVTTTTQTLAVTAKEETRRKLSSYIQLRRQHN